MSARVVLLTGPSGSGKSHLARSSGLPVLVLDDFYRDGDDPALPMSRDLGIVDWDDPRSWDDESALAVVLELCRTGSAPVPTYSIAASRRTGSHPIDLGDAEVFVAEGIFAAQIVADAATQASSRMPSRCAAPRGRTSCVAWPAT